MCVCVCVCVCVLFFPVKGIGFSQGVASTVS